jgi:carboxyl-terminal processing protease
MAANRGLIIQYTFDYTDKHREELQKYDEGEELLRYLKRQNLLEKFAAYAEEKGLKRRNLLMAKSQTLLERALYGNIIYNMLGMEVYTAYLNRSDKMVEQALDILEQGKAFPQKPAPEPASASATKKQ